MYMLSYFMNYKKFELNDACAHCAIMHYHCCKIKCFIVRIENFYNNFIAFSEKVKSTPKVALRSLHDVMILYSKFRGHESTLQNTQLVKIQTYIKKI